MTSILVVPFTEHADCSKPIQHRTQRCLCGEWTGKHTGHASIQIPVQESLVKDRQGLEFNGEETGASHLQCTTGSACVIVESTRVNKNLRSATVLSGVLYLREAGKGWIQCNLCMLVTAHQLAWQGCRLTWELSMTMAPAASPELRMKELRST